MPAGGLLRRPSLCAPGGFDQSLRRAQGHALLPPVVTGPIIISIGLILSPSAINNCKSNWLIALTALVTIIIFNIWGRGMFKIIPKTVAPAFPLTRLRLRDRRPLLFPRA